MTTPTHDTTSPTREEVAYHIFTCTFSPLEDPDVMQRIWSRDEWPESKHCAMREADAILALFAPALAAAEKRGMERAITLCAPHEDDDAMDRQAKAHCAAAIRAEMEKM